MGADVPVSYYRRWCNIDANFKVIHSLIFRTHLNKFNSTNENSLIRLPFKACMPSFCTSIKDSNSYYSLILKSDYFQVNSQMHRIERSVTYQSEYELVCPSYLGNALKNSIRGTKIVQAFQIASCACRCFRLINSFCFHHAFLFHFPHNKRHFHGLCHDIFLLQARSFFMSSWCITLPWTWSDYCDYISRQVCPRFQVCALQKALYRWIVILSPIVDAEYKYI